MNKTTTRRTSIILFEQKENETLEFFEDRVNMAIGDYETDTEILDFHTHINTCAEWSFWSVSLLMKWSE